MLEGEAVRLPKCRGQRFPQEGILSRPLHQRMTIALTITGIVLILAAVRDVFHTLFNPSKQGDLSEWIERGARPW